MLTILGSLLGFTTSIVPEILGYFRQNQANEQELKMLEAKAKYASALSELKLKELDVQADIGEAQNIYKHDQGLDAGKFINALRGSVRPVISYLFVLTYIGIKIALIYAMIVDQKIDWTAAVQQAWGQTDAIIFSTIISFWFGNRAMSKARSWHNK